MHMPALDTLGDPMRRRIVEVLLGGERSVSDIVDHAGIHQSGVSRHLRILETAGFVTKRRAGQFRFYSLRPEPFVELDAWLQPYRQLWEQRLDRFGAALEKQRETKGKNQK